MGPLNNHGARVGSDSRIEPQILITLTELVGKDLAAAIRFAEFNCLGQRVDFTKSLPEIQEQLAALTGSTAAESAFPEGTTPLSAASLVRHDEIGEDFKGKCYRTGARTYTGEMLSLRLSCPPSIQIAIAKRYNIDASVLGDGSLTQAVSNNPSRLSGEVFVGTDDWLTGSGTKPFAKSITTWMFTDSSRGPVILMIDAYKATRANTSTKNSNAPRNCHCQISCVDPFTGEIICSYLVQQIFDVRSFKTLDEKTYGFNTGNVARRLHSKFSHTIPSAYFKLNYTETLILREYNRRLELAGAAKVQHLDLVLDQEFKAQHHVTQVASPDLSRFEHYHVMDIFSKMNWEREVRRLADDDLENLLRWSIDPLEFNHKLSDGKTTIFRQSSAQVKARTAGFRGASRPNK